MLELTRWETRLELINEEWMVLDDKLEFITEVSELAKKGKGNMALAETMLDMAQEKDTETTMSKEFRRQKKLAEAFIALATSPQVQADGIVKKFNWYPGIDAANLEGKLDKAAWDKLFTDVTPADLAKNGKVFPIAPYFNDILEGYEKKVAN